MLLDIFSIHLFFVNIFRVAHHDYTSPIVDQEEDLQDQEDRDYDSELCNDHSGAMTHPPHRSY